MKRKMISKTAIPFLTLTLGLFLVPAAVSHAQERPPDAEPRLDRELAQTVERFMVQRLTRFLELDAAQRETVLPLVEKLTQARRLHTRQRREAIRTLGAMSQDSGVDEEMLRLRLNSFYREEEEFRDLERRTNEEVRSQLDVHQEARLLAFEERFRKEMRRRMEAAREDRGRRPWQESRPPRDGPSR